MYAYIRNFFVVNTLYISRIDMKIPFFFRNDDEKLKVQELSEIYENLSQSIFSNDLSNELFSKEILTLKKFIWASNLLDNFHINLVNKRGKKFIGIMPL